VKLNNCPSQARHAAFPASVIGKTFRFSAFITASTLALSLTCAPKAEAQLLPIRLWSGIGHLSTVTSVAMSTDGATMVSGSYDSTLKLWRTSDGALLRTFVGHVGDVRSVAYSRDGSMVASGGSDRIVRVWRASDGLLLRTFVGHGDVIRSVAFSPDSSMVLSGGQDRNVYLWRVSDGALLRSFAGSATWVLSVAFAPNGATVTSGGADSSLNHWRVSDGALLWRINGHGDWVMSVAFSPDGSTIASGSVDMTAKLWRASDGALVREFTDFGDAVNCVAFSPTGNLMTADWTRTLKKWRTTDGALLQSYIEGSLVNSICFTPDDSKFGYGLADSKVALALNSTGTGGGTTTPALDAVVSTTKPAYVNREKATILVSITDGAKAVSGASVSVVVTSSKGTRTTMNGSTAANGIATFTYTVNSTKQGIGTYRVDVSASKSGYTSTTDSITFSVTK